MTRRRALSERTRFPLIAPVLAMSRRLLPRFSGSRGPVVHAMGQGPWGGPSGDGRDPENPGSGAQGGAGSGPDEGAGDNGATPGSGGPRNPWTRPGDAGRREPGTPPAGGPSLIEDLWRRGREGLGGRGGFGGPGGGFPGGPEVRTLWPIALGIILVLWLLLTGVHRIGPQERGVVMLFGKYSRTMTPGIGFTLPAPIETVETVDVEEIRTIDIGSVANDDQNLVLTGDQNIIDLAYSVRWNIRNPELYKFQLADPDTTIREVAEAAMRSVIATVSLNDALGAGRTGIEQQVGQRMQEILDGYHSGIRLQGVAIKQADPPDAVNDAFKEVSAAKQDATTYVNQARAYAQQLTARAQGEAAAFDKVYEQYRLAPEVTRRRMYYETMEAILADTDKTIVETNNVVPYMALPGLKRGATKEGASASQEGGQ